MTLTFRTTLIPFGPAAAIELTDAQVDELGGGRRAPVRVTIGERTAPLRVAVMDGRTVIGLSKAVRAQLGVDIGDEIDVSIDRDDTERIVALPDDLAAALEAEPELRAAFDALAPSRRKELARTIAEARRPETRERRVRAALDGLRASAGPTGG